MKLTTMNSDELHRAAIEGYKGQLEQIRAKIEELESHLNGHRELTKKPIPFESVATEALKPPRKKRVMSAAGRRRIKAAQKARWAKYHAAKKGA